MAASRHEAQDWASQRVLSSSKLRTKDTSQTNLVNKCSGKATRDRPEALHEVHQASIIRHACMAKSRFEYVKTFETDDRLLPHCWIVIRIDGKGFTRYSATPTPFHPRLNGESILLTTLSSAGFLRSMALRSPMTPGLSTSWTSVQG